MDLRARIAMITDWIAYFVMRLALVLVNVAASMSEEQAAFFGESVRRIDWRVQTRSSGEEGRR